MLPPDLPDENNKNEVEYHELLKQRAQDLWLVTVEE